MILQRLGATWLGPKIILQLFQCTYPLCNLVCSMQQSNCSTRTEQDANVTLLHTINVNTACYSCMFLGYAIVYNHVWPPCTVTLPSTPILSSDCTLHPPQILFTVHIWLFHLLLLQALSHVRGSPDLGVLRLHNAGLLHLLPHPWDGVILLFSQVCALHLPKHQNGLRPSCYQLSML